VRPIARLLRVRIISYSGVLTHSNAFVQIPYFPDRKLDTDWKVLQTAFCFDVSAWVKITTGVIGRDAQGCSPHHTARPFYFWKSASSHHALLLLSSFRLLFSRKDSARLRHVRKPDPFSYVFTKHTNLHASNISHRRRVTYSGRHTSISILERPISSAGEQER